MFKKSFKESWKKFWQRRELRELPILLFLFLFAYLLRDKPSIEKDSLTTITRYHLNEHLANHTENKTISGEHTLSQNMTSTKGEEKTNLKREKLKYSYLTHRNPFSPEGSYSELILPENPYTLVAILTGKEKRVIFKLFTGEMVIAKERDTLIDGAKVLKIKKNSVIIERLGNRKELRLFQIEVEKWKPKK